MNAAAKKDYEAGLAYTRRNSTVDKALPLLERAVAADPDSPLTWAGLAEAQWFQYYITKDQGWLDRTSESLRQAQERNLDLAPVHRAAGLPLANAGHYEQAEAEYLRAIDLEPANGDAYRRLGQVYDNSGRLDEALAAFQKAVEREPGYFKTYRIWARTIRAAATRARLRGNLKSACNWRRTSRMPTMFWERFTWIWANTSTGNGNCGWRSRWERHPWRSITWLMR